MAIRATLRRLLIGDRRPKPTPTPSMNPPAPSEDLPAKPAQQQEPKQAGQHELVLYKFDSCPYCRRVLRVIDKLDIADQIVLRDTRQDPQWRADLREKTGRTQVPCLFIDGKPMFESLDIIDWLNAEYG